MVFVLAKSLALNDGFVLPMSLVVFREMIISGTSQAHFDEK